MAPNTQDPAPKNHKEDNGVPKPLTGEEVVISGMSGLFPKSDSVLEFMENLFNKVDMVSSGKVRWRVQHPEIPKHCGIINGINKFDAQFFKVHHKQAINLDPMCKKLLEHAYSAIFDAGINPAELRGKKVGVFIGSAFSESEKIFIYDVLFQNGFGITGCNKAMYANRISYWLDAKGPSYTLDLACASSMACVEHAYRSISSGECEAAIVGGSNLCIHPMVSLNMKKIGFLCLDGKTKSFDKNGDGYVRSDSISAIFLQKSKDAKRIYSELYYAKASYSRPAQGQFLPSRPANEIIDFLESFYSDIDVLPGDVEYIEANGSGIAEADENELEAIGRFYAKDRVIKVGSVKSNMGHSEPASGSCALTKVCLAYHKGQLPGNLHYTEPQYQIPAVRDGRIEVVTENTHFGRGYAALNTFSYGGTNIHVLMKGHFKPKESNRYKSSIPYLVLTSGRQEDCVNNTLDIIKSQPIDAEQIGLLHGIYETNVTEHTCRGYAIFDTNQDNNTVSVAQEVDYVPGYSRPVWFVYSGMGSQWATMGADLMRIPIFSEAIQKCHKVLEPKGVNLIKILTNDDKNMFDNILHSFVGIAAVQIGLTDILKGMGIVPDHIIGHSVGELGCAYADGSFTAEEMILSAYSRGLVSVQTPFITGSMAAVGLGYRAVKDLCPPEIEVACHNSSESSTISGPADVMKKFVAELKKQGIFAREVPCSNIAYHSQYIAEAGPGLLKYLSEVIKDPKPRSDKWVSTSVPQDKWHEPAAKYSSAEYHTNNLLNPVLFEETSKLIPDNALVIEMAPHGLLQAIIKRSLSQCTHIPLTRRGHANPVNFLLEAIGKLYLTGLNPKVKTLYPKIEFPVSTETPLLSHYVGWEHSELWPLGQYSEKTRVMAACRDFIVSTCDDDYKYLTGYVRDGVIVFPEAAYLIIVWETLAMTNGEDYRNMSVVFNNVQYHSEVEIKAEEPAKFEIMIHKGSQYFEVIHKQSVVVTGTIRNVKHTLERQKEGTPSTDKDVLLNMQDIYKVMKMKGYSCKDEFQSIHSINTTTKTASIKWNDKWLTFLDSLIQLNIFLRDHAGTSSIKYIGKLSIDVSEHLKHVKNNVGDNIYLNGVHHDVFNVTQCSGVNLHDLTLTDKPIVETEPDILRTQSFVPYYNAANIDLKTALHVNLQIISDNVEKNLIKIVEVASTRYVKVSEALSAVIDNIVNTECLVNSISENNFNTATKPIESPNLIIVDRLLADENKMKTLYNRVSSDAFILDIEENPNQIATKYNLFNVITIMTVQECTLVLLNKRNEVDNENVTFIPVLSGNNFSWVSKIPIQFKRNRKVILLSERQPYCGLLGMVKKLRKKYGNKIVLMVTDGNPASYFDSENNIFKDQLQKKLAFNVLKQGQWGSYYYIPSAQSTIMKHITLTSSAPGDFDNLKWVEAPSVADNENYVKVCYASISDQDALKAVGKNIENHKEFGMDFSGIDSVRNKVMGLVLGGALSSTVKVDPNLLWPVPSCWTLEDAATIPLAYAHAYYCLRIAHKLKRGSNVFVNGGSKAFSQAIIAVCLSMDCNVYVSVEDIKQKECLLRNFPKLDGKNIACTDIDSIDNMVITNTKNHLCDVVINCDSGASRQSAMKLTGSYGYILDVSDNDMQANKDFGMAFLWGARTYKSVKLANLFRPEFEQEKKLLQLLVVEGIANGDVKPIVRVVYSPTEISKAFRLHATEKLGGKILIRMLDEELYVNPRVQCSSDAAYIVVCNGSTLGIELTDHLIKRGARKFVIHIDPNMMDGYLKFKMMSWVKNAATVKLSSEKLHSGNDCGNLFKEATKLGNVLGIFIVHNFTPKYKEDCFVPENISTKYKNIMSVTANLEDLSKKALKGLKHFVIFNYSPKNAIDEYIVSASEKICEARNEMSLPALSFRVDSIDELENNMEDSVKIKPLKLNTAFIALESSLKLGYTNVVTFKVNKQRQPDFLQKASRIIGVKDLDDIKDSLNLSEIAKEEIKFLIKETCDINITTDKVAEIDVATLKKFGQMKKQKNKVDEGLGVFYTYIDEDECLASEPMVQMPTKLSNATEEEQEIDPKDTYMMLIPGFEGHHHIFTSICERLKVKALAFQLSPDMSDDSIQTMASKILTFTKKRFELKQKFYLLGYSFGVNIALELAFLLEKEGSVGVVYCLDSSPDALRVQLDAYLGNLTDTQLQNTIVQHMYRLMTGRDSEELKQEIDDMDSWTDKIESCVYRLRGSATYSNQYKRFIMQGAYQRIMMAREYEPDFKLESQIVLMKGIPKSSQNNGLAEDYNLSKYTTQPVQVFQMDSDHALAVNDFKVSNIVNRFLDPQLLEEFEKKALCDTYISGSFQLAV